MPSRSTTGIADDDPRDRRDLAMQKLKSLLTDNALVRFLVRHTKRQYRPEKYYMRGPGPKALAKLGNESPDINQSSGKAKTLRN